VDSNWTLIRPIKKKIDDYLRRWHDVLSEALWAHRILKHGATKVTPFELVYGQDAVLHVEVNMQTCQIIEQGTLSVEKYSEAMISKLDEVPEIQFKVLHEIEKEKIQEARAYNKWVREKSFHIGE
jgi:hypothetical protein